MGEKERGPRGIGVRGGFFFLFIIFWLLTHFLPMMQTLIVILQYGYALGLARVVVRGRVDDVAGEKFLPEWEAAGWT